MMQDIERVLISEEEIRARVQELGAQLTREYEGKDLVFIGLLRGSVIFFSDLVRAVPLPCRIDFLSASSYGGGAESTGLVRLSRDISLDITNSHVVIIEDIIDSGLTLSHVAEYLRSRGAASLKICTLLDKPSRRKIPITADYIGFHVPNEFLVGYGLDYADAYRNLPFVGILKREIYEK